MLCTARISAKPFLSNFSRNFSSSVPRSKQRLVILGSGWGGYEVLRGVDKNHWGASDPLPYHNPPLLFIDVTVLSPNTYFNFTPLLASCAVGTLEFRCAIEPVSQYYQCPYSSNVHLLGPTIHAKSCMYNFFSNESTLSGHSDILPSVVRWNGFVSASAVKRVVLTYW